jgi:hypothetical protein
MARTESSSEAKSAVDLLSPSKTLQNMKDNPKDNWTMADVEKACREIGLLCIPPARGSHYKVRSDVAVGRILTIPKARPIKPPYVRQLVALAEMHLSAAREKGVSDES